MDFFSFPICAIFRYGMNLYHTIFARFNAVFLRVFEVSISNRPSQPASTKTLHHALFGFFQAIQILKLALTTSLHTRSYYVHGHRVIWTYVIYIATEGNMTLPYQPRSLEWSLHRHLFVFHVAYFQPAFYTHRTARGPIYLFQHYQITKHT